MLTLTRKPLRQAGRPDGRYRSAALALLCDGELLGEILVTEVVIDPFTGSIQVKLGFNLTDEVKVVRADAMDRPQGPSHEWLVAREACFDAPTALPPTPENPRNGRHADPSASGAHYVFRDALADATGSDQRDWRWER